MHLHCKVNCNVKDYTEMILVHKLLYIHEVQKRRVSVHKSLLQVIHCYIHSGIDKLALIHSSKVQDYTMMP